MRFLCLLFGLLPQLLPAQLLWTSTFGEPNRREAYQHLDTLPGGDILLAGYADDPTTQRSVLLVRRMREDETAVWTRRYPQVATEEVDAMSVGAGRIVLAGRTASDEVLLLGIDHAGEPVTDTVRFGLRRAKLVAGPVGEVYLVGNTAHRDLHVLRLDEQLRPRWTRELGGSNWIEAHFLRRYANGDVLLVAYVDGDNALYRLSAENELRWGRPISDTVLDWIHTAHLAADGTLTLAGSRRTTYFDQWPQLWRFDGAGRRTWEKRLWFVPPADTSRRRQSVQACVPLPGGGYRLLVTENWEHYHQIHVDAAGDSLALHSWTNPRYEDDERLYLHPPLLLGDGRLQWPAYRYHRDTRSVDAAWVRTDAAFNGPVVRIYGTRSELNPNEVHRFTLALPDGGFGVVSQAQYTSYGPPGRTLLHRTSPRGRRLAVNELSALRDRWLYGALEVNGEVWIVASDPGESAFLHRYDLAGEAVGAPVLLPDYTGNGYYSPIVRLSNGNVAIRGRTLSYFSPAGELLRTTNVPPGYYKLALLPDDRGGLTTGQTFDDWTDPAGMHTLQLFHFDAEAKLDYERRLPLHPRADGQMSAIERVSDTTFLVLAEAVDYRFDTSGTTIDTTVVTATLRLTDLEPAATAYPFDTFVPFWFGLSHGNTQRFYFHYLDGFWRRSGGQWLQHDGTAQPVYRYPHDASYLWSAPVRGASGNYVFARGVSVQGQSDLMLLAYGREAPLPGAVAPNAAAVSVYPNPADHRLNVHIDEPGFYGSATLVLYTPDGKALRRATQDLVGRPVTVPLDAMRLPSGAYYLHVRYGTSQRTLPVFIR